MVVLGCRFLLLALLINLGFQTSCTGRVNSDSNSSSSAEDGVTSVSKPSPVLIPAGGAEFHVTPGGNPRNNGRKDRPLDLATALSERSPAKPGDTIWLHEGTYTGSFTSELKGDASKPILVRQFPGERARIDGTLTVKGSHSWYWGFEVFDSNPDRARERPDLVLVLGPFTKFINLIVHDGGDGIVGASVAEGAEFYGNIIYNNGYQSTQDARGHGHAMYLQNETNTKLIKDNIVFNGYGYGIHAYGQQGSLKGFEIVGNACFNSGAFSREQAHPDLLIGGFTGAERIKVTDNYFYGSIELHYTNRRNQDLIFSQNHVAGTTEIYYWQNLDISGNRFYSNVGPLMGFGYPPAFDVSNYEWDNNAYYFWGDRVPFEVNPEDFFSFANWKKRTGFDQHSSFENRRPKGLEVAVRANQYDNNRVSIIVYNWDKRDTVNIDVSSVLTAGAKYEVRNVQDYWGAPVAGGTYQGGQIALPMNGLKVGEPIGVGTPSSRSTAPEFNVFLLIKQ
jgi:hypothetical protein